MTIPSVHANLLAIAGSYRGILSDAFGVFWSGSGLYPGVSETFKELVGAGKRVIILSNATQMGEKEADKYANFGLKKGEHYHALITSGDVAKSLFERQELPFAIKTRRFWVFGGNHERYGSPHERLFQTTPFERARELQEADFIYIDIPTIEGKDQTDSRVFENELRSLVATGLPMVCANPDRFVKEGSPPKQVVRQGEIARLYESLGGSVYRIGKPAAAVYQVAAAMFAEHGIPLSEVLMVGDNVETDIEGAYGAQMPSALVTQTGLSGDAIAQGGLEAFYSTLPVQRRPTYLIERVAQVS